MVKRKLIILIISLLLVSCPLDKARYHYDSESGHLLKGFNEVQSKLYGFYGSYLPEKIVVKYDCSKSSSHFNPDSNVVIINNCTQEPLRPLIAHETSHIALSHMTKGISATERFRFIDEGFASIMGYKIQGEDKVYKYYALSVAGSVNDKGGISFKKVENWSSYFGSWEFGIDDVKREERNRDAYEIGASFVYYILDNYGEDNLKKLFLDIGNTKSLSKSFANLFYKSKTQIEKEWVNYIDKQYGIIKTLAVNKQPQIEYMYPSNGASDIDPKLAQIKVVFNVPMNGKICVIADCKDICYKNAYWKNNQTLIIKLPKGLISQKEYRFFLGDEKCRLKTVFGRDVPIVHWHFSTK